jgi:mono/diheme cytochrome c family protein
VDEIMIRRVRPALFFGLFALVCCAMGSARAADTPDLARGRQIFETRCIFCHGEGLGHPAWQLLALKKGKDKAEILGRPDLTPAYIEHVVRNGFIEMPPFRASEISNSDLDALAAYVVHPNPAPETKQP